VGRVKRSRVMKSKKVQGANVDGGLGPEIIIALEVMLLLLWVSIMEEEKKRG
jgi:hypothetical protein